MYYNPLLDAINKFIDKMLKKSKEYASMVYWTWILILFLIFMTMLFLVQDNISGWRYVAISGISVFILGIPIIWWWEHYKWKGRKNYKK